jgi:hypothetical protein
MRIGLFALVSIALLVGCTEDDEQACAERLHTEIDDLVEIVQGRSLWTDVERAEAVSTFLSIGEDVTSVLNDADRNVCDYRIHGSELVIDE